MGKRSVELASRLQKDTPLLGVEIGVRYGKNAKQLLDLLPKLRLWLVDPWEKPPAGDSFYHSGDGIADRPPGYWKKCYRDFKDIIKPVKNRVEIFRCRSHEAAQLARKNRQNHLFDFVFIDGDHSYDGVKRDIIEWYPLIKKGGLICGHDYGHSRIGEVKRAVDEQFGERVQLGNDMTWFVQVV
jgi:hypothetical protein